MLIFYLVVSESSSVLSSYFMVFFSFLKTMKLNLSIFMSFIYVAV